MSPLLSLCNPIEFDHHYFRFCLVCSCVSLVVIPLGIGLRGHPQTERLGKASRRDLQDDDPACELETRRICPELIGPPQHPLLSGREQHRYLADVFNRPINLQRGSWGGLVRDPCQVCVGRYPKGQVQARQRNVFADSPVSAGERGYKG